MSGQNSPILCVDLNLDENAWELIRKDVSLNSSKYPNMEESQPKICEYCGKPVSELNKCSHCMKNFCRECGKEHLQKIFGKLDDLEEKLQKKLTEWTQLKVTFQISCEETLMKIAELEKALLDLVGDRTSSLLDDCGLVMRRRLWEYDTQIELMQQIQRNLNNASSGLAYDHISLQDAEKAIFQVENLLTEAENWKKEYKMDLNYDPFDVERVNWSLITTGRLFTRPSKDEEMLKEKDRRKERARRQLEEWNSFKPIKTDDRKYQEGSQNPDSGDERKLRPLETGKSDIYGASEKSDWRPSALNSHNLRPIFDSIKGRMVMEQGAPVPQITPGYLDGLLAVSGSGASETFGEMGLEASAFRRKLENFPGQGVINAPGTLGGLYGPRAMSQFRPALSRTLGSVRRIEAAVEALSTVMYFFLGFSI